MAKSEDGTNRFFSRERLIGAGWAIVVAVIIALVTNYFSARPAITAICSRTSVNSPAYSDEYVNKLKEKIDGLNKKATAADKLMRALVVAGGGKDRGDQIIKGIIDARNDYAEISVSILNDFVSTDGSGSKISGEISCVVTNSGDTKASKIDISLPSQPVGLYVGGKSIAFDAQKPVYEIDSLNPQDGVTVVAQYGPYFSPEYASPPTVTFAEGTAVTFMKASFIGFPASVASFLSTFRGTPVLVSMAIFFLIFVLPVFLMMYLTKLGESINKNKENYPQGGKVEVRPKNKIARLGSVNFVVRAGRRKKRF
ncbi:hypothetical protein [Burkholderia gladioli]|uniref:hypothetical protein n=1 Tax=Burkholderia gladioli TaxID=28095 RepID=UPI000F52FF6B|nr:hypothetical protein [Burkholderia gladioli]